MFLNLSNHPSAAWGSAQRAAAEALAPGPLQDLPFPEVDPSWDTQEVTAFAQLLASQVLAHNPIAAMVQGEHTLTLALVDRPRNGRSPLLCRYLTPSLHPNHPRRRLHPKNSPF